MKVEKTPKTPLQCYIAAYVNTNLDPYLESNGFSKGIICFAIPALGILFRCRAEGKVIDLEFSALVSLLDFVKSKLENERIRNVQIFSSNPELVFALSEKSLHMRKGSTRRAMLDQYAKIMRIAVGYAKASDNRALLPSVEYPSLPQGQKVNLDIDENELRKTEFKPFQKGVKI